MIYDPVRKKGLSKKLLPKWKGPYEVVKNISPNLYRVRDLSRGVARTNIHVERMKPYVDRSPEDTAPAPKEVSVPASSSAPVKPPIAVNDDSSSESESESNSASSDNELIPEDEKEVEEILAHRVFKRKNGKSQTQYLVKWKDPKVGEPEWLPHHDLNCPDLIAAYRRKQKEILAQKKQAK